MQALRGALLGMASLTFFTGLAGIPLAEATAISSIGPILVTVFAVLLLGEKAPAGTASGRCFTWNSGFQRRKVS